MRGPIRRTARIEELVPGVHIKRYRQQGTIEKATVTAKALAKAAKAVAPDAPRVKGRNQACLDRCRS